MQGLCEGFRGLRFFADGKGGSFGQNHPDGFGQHLHLQLGEGVDLAVHTDMASARGGEGAVREAVEFLLAARMDGKNPADYWTAATGPARV